MKRYLIASLAVALSGGVATALASSDGEPARAQQPMLSIEQAVALAKHYSQGTVTKVELERKGDRTLYEAKVADGRGEVRELRFDARTAELLRSSRDRR